MSWCNLTASGSQCETIKYDLLVITLFIDACAELQDKAIVLTGNYKADIVRQKR